MKIGHAFFIIVSSLWTVGASLGAPESDKPIHLRVAAYNVEFGKNATPEEIGRMFKSFVVSAFSVYTVRIIVIFFCFDGMFD